MKKAVWLSYDLGVRGDYTGLYEWLDNQNAKETGKNIAFFKYEIKKEENLKEKLKKDILKHIDINKRYIIYIISRGDDKKLKGTFLLGRRRASPWKGYGIGEGEIDNIDE